MPIKLTSTAFKEGGDIPKKHTCDGTDISPHLSWESIPANIKSIALICDDPDAPMGTWVHWVIFNIPPKDVEIAENVMKEKELKNGAKQGENDFGKIGYGGPCPPGGSKHRYFFKIYALDTFLELNAGITKEELVSAMESHILDEGKLMAKYGR